MLRTQLVLAAAALLSILIAAPVSADPGPHPDFQAQLDSIEELSGLEGEEFEIGYVKRIVPHHDGATEMATTMMDKVVHDELSADLEMIVETQEAEIELLSAYLQDTYDQDVMPDEAFVMGPDMMQALADAEPEAAEIMFLLMIREHHQTAILIGELALERDIADVLLDQAQQMVEAQRTEQVKFAGYLEEWYGITAPEPTGDMRAAMELAMEQITARGTAPDTAMEPIQQSPLTGVGLLAIAAAVGLAVGRIRLASGGRKGALPH